MGKTSAIQTALFALVALVASGGCSSFRGDPDARFAYENTQRSAAYRGDGVSDEQQAAYYGDGPTKNSKKFKLEDLDPFRAPKTVRKYTGQGPNREIARRQYQEADAEFRQAADARERNEDSKSLFLAAADSFASAGERWPESALEQDALFMAGESYYFADRYTKANERFEVLIKKYPNTRHLDTVGVRRFTLAEYWIDASQARPDGLFTPNLIDKRRPWRDAYGHGIRIYDKIRLDDPTGRLADDATMAAANANFRQERYVEAGEMYDDLIRTFPNSEHQFNAHLLALQAKLASYQGAGYDDDPIVRAEEILTQIRKQFPREADEEREFLQRAFAEIRFLQSERELKFAKYYDRRGEYGAARFYYNSLASDFSDTPQGQQANERLAQIQGKPATPPQRFGWLTALFPEQEDVKPLIQSGDGGKIRR